MPSASCLPWNWVKTVDEVLFTKWPVFSTKTEMCLTWKMKMLTKIISWFVFNFLYWLVNPLSSVCHCRNAGSGAQPQPGGMGGQSPAISKKLLLLSFYRNKTYHIKSGHIWMPSTSCLKFIFKYHCCVWYNTNRKKSQVFVSNSAVSDCKIQSFCWLLSAWVHTY